MLHLAFEAFVWTFACYGIYFQRKSLKRGFVYFAIHIGLCAIALELVSFFAYMLQFLGDALISGVTSKEISVSLINLVSWKRWLAIDWTASCFEGFVVIGVTYCLVALAGVQKQKAKERREKEARKVAASRQAQLRRQEVERKRHEKARRDKIKREKQFDRIMKENVVVEEEQEVLMLNAPSNPS